MPRPPRIDRTAILAATLDLADDAGLPAVSMRAVADRLGVTPMALYRHVGDKQQLLDGIVERLLLELPLPDPALPWHERLSGMAAALRATARRHPDVFPLLLRRPAVTPGARRVRDGVYSALCEAGVEEAQVPRMERLLSTFMLGFAASEAGGRFTATCEELDGDLALAARWLFAALADRPPSTAGREGSKRRGAGS